MRAAKLESGIRREQIAQAALSLIARQGLKGLSVAAVADQVGLVPSAIYRHFQGKDQVLNAVLDLIGLRLQENVASVQAETADPLERIRRLLLRHLQLVQVYQAIPRVLFSDEVYSGHPERKAKLYGIIRGYLQKIEEMVKAGQRQGRIRPEVPPETVAVMFMGMVAPSAFLWHLSDGGFNISRHTERAWKLFRAAIQEPPTARKKKQHVRARVMGKKRAVSRTM